MSSADPHGTLRKPFQIFFILFVCLGIYYPTIFNSTLTIDDVDMVRRMANATFSWGHLFSPSSSFYYRPLLILTFWIDKWLWDFSPTFMLMENMFLHAFNALFVFFITERMTRNDSSSYFAPLVAGIIFAIHPIATESINWVSGRTDLQAGFFSLFSLFLLLKALERKSWMWLSLSLLAYLCAILSKEIFIFFFPAAGYLICLRTRERKQKDESSSFSTPWKPALFYMAPVFITGVGYALWRTVSYGASSRNLGYLLDRIPYGGIDSLRVIFKVFGFYVKKLIVPQPLNFAIVEISNLYVILGVVSLLGLLFVFRRRSTRWGFVVAALHMIAPAILIALTNIAWTPLAERYIYFSTALFVIGLASLVSALPQLTRKKTAAFILIGLTLWMVPAVVTTVQRNILWQDKEAFYAQAIKLSPNFNRLRNEYGIALLEKNKSDKALQQFSLGKTGHGMSNNAVINEAQMLAKNGNLDQALAVLSECYPDIHGMNERALRCYSFIRARMLRDESYAQDKVEIYRDVQETYSLIYEKTKEPLFLYRSGQIALSMDDIKVAADLFRQAYDNAPEDAYYKKAAGKLADKLKKEAE